MIKTSIFTILVILFIPSIQSIHATNRQNKSNIELDFPIDSTRLVELDRYWEELSRTVIEGDFEGYKEAYKDAAVVVFASGNNKFSQFISSALEGWKQGFIDTKNGKVSSNVEFRFSQRIGDNSTAHETGIFHYSSIDDKGKTIADQFVHFEMLLIKENSNWFALMEYQKTSATPKEWEALK